MRRQFLFATATTISLLVLAACGTGTESSGTRTRNAVGSIAPTATVLAGEVVASTALSSWATPPTVPYDYVIVGMGDSFGSGEGNPAKKKTYALTWRTTRWWNADGTTDPEAASDCHRSSESGFYKTVRRLKSTFTHFNFINKNFACTGAKIQDLYSRSYIPPTEQNTQTDGDWTRNTEYPAQILQIDAWLREKEPVQSRARIDAMYISIGGNDAGFAPAIEHCIGVDNCVTENRVIRDLNESINNTLLNAYTLLWRTVNSADRYAIPRSVVISEYPNFIKNENGQWCVSDDFPLERVTSNEWSYLWEQIGAPLLTKIREFAATKNWAIAPMEDRYKYNVLCDSNDRENAWVNNDEFAQDNQGNDMLGNVGLILSMGMVHPNDRGYEAYADAIEPQLRAQILSTSTPPGNVTNFRVTQVSPTPNSDGEIQMKFSWTPPIGKGAGRAKRSGYQIEMRGRNGVRTFLNMGEGNTISTWVDPRYYIFNISACGQVLNRANYRACSASTEISITPPTTVPRGPTTTSSAGFLPGNGTGNSTTTTLPRSGTGSNSGSVAGN